MAAGVTTMTISTSTEIIAADVNRDHITIQLHDANVTYLAFGEDAADATGIALLYPGCSVRVRGPKARLAVNGYSGGEAVIGYETHEDVEYRAGAYAGPFT